MSPLRFAEQLRQLAQLAGECLGHCELIRKVRHLSSKKPTENLDRLEFHLKTFPTNINTQFEYSRRTLGSRMDYGDEEARRNLNAVIEVVQTELKPQLYAIATSRDIKSAGFSKLLGTWKMVEGKVNSTFKDLAQRLSAPADIPAPRRTHEAAPAAGLGKITLDRASYNSMVGQMENSWYEVKASDGSIIYVNSLDTSKARYERPDGYIMRIKRSGSSAPY